MTVSILNGCPATAADLRTLALVNYGHFTTLQVRGQRSRGLDLHLRRLQDATRELFGTDLDPARVRDGMRRALRQHGAADCTLRVTVFARENHSARTFAGGGDAHRIEPDLLVTTSAPAEPMTVPTTVKSYRHQRVLPHLKHVGTFALLHYRRLAQQAGFDDAVFEDEAGQVSEGSVWNLGFWDGRRVTWPQAPALRGTCEQLLQQGLEQLGVTQVRREVGLAQLASFRGGFACNSRGVWPLACVDDTAWVTDAGMVELLRRALATRPWQPL